MPSLGLKGGRKSGLGLSIGSRGECSWRRTWGRLAIDRYREWFIPLPGGHVLSVWWNP